MTEFNPLTEKQIQQIKTRLDYEMPYKLGFYERSADRKAWNCYPCDDHVIRAVKVHNGWSATLTTMRDRQTAIDIVGGRTRAIAVGALMIAYGKILKRKSV